MGNLCSCGHVETERPSSRRPVRRPAHGHGGGVGGHGGADEFVIVEEDPYHNQFTFTSLFPYLESQNVRWDGEYASWTYSHLKRKRLEFWDTRVVGNTEMWCALRSSVEMINQLDERVKNGETVPLNERGEQLATCEAILESASLTKFSLNSSEKNMLHCYDRLGVKYDLPFFAFVLPKNLLKIDPENEKVGAGVTESKEEATPLPDDEKKREARAESNAAAATSATAPASEVAPVDASSQAPATIPAATSQVGDAAEDKEKIIAKASAEQGKSGRDPNQMKLKFRFSNGMPDHAAYFPIRSTIGELKKFLEKEKKVAADKQLILFQGRRYTDQVPLSNCPFKSGVILQVMVRG